MKYELCKKLKDAGFPQAKEGEYINDKEERIFAYPEHFGKIPRFAYAPTLSELIEVCGDRFITLTNDRGDIKKFWAEGHTGGIGEFVMPEEIIEFEGSTPEEAVAELWLALKEKK